MKKKKIEDRVRIKGLPDTGVNRGAVNHQQILAFVGIPQ
jgi:hypothetical protein